MNKNKPGERQRFTVAHELGHLFMRFSRKLDPVSEEKLCHRFAGAFLMPADCVYVEFGRERKKIDFRELQFAKKNFGISMQAILRRLLDLNIISDSIYKSKIIQFSKAGYRKNEPDELSPERSNRFESFVYRALAEKMITISRAAEYLQVDVSRIKKELDVEV